VAISLAGRKRASSEALRELTLRAVDDPEARVVRSTTGVTVVREVRGAGDPRADAERLRQTVASALQDDVSAGVAGPKPGSSGAHFALVQAEHALTVGRGLHGHGRTVHFDDLGIFCFVLNQPASDIRALSERILGPLVADARHEDLFDTLEAYLRSGGSANAVARTLFVHRNTVRHRLRRIAKLTGADLDDPDTRLGLQLAILGRRALAQTAS
jgi:DNA-binding PucR family transcriptional regulator